MHYGIDTVRDDTAAKTVQDSGSCARRGLAVVAPQGRWVSGRPLHLIFFIGAPNCIPSHHFCEAMTCKESKRLAQTELPPSGSYDAVEP
ncbi:hypothetical protein Y032_0110g190 [Ancylostoma ceylanicum]|uniref:Uncharacterized protein n=1 Tax=Ancylostoma ceylanicum TaxID=53326 RepID=A0A016TES1_9BILA|nr:hypothetical protein Y032_0110g190 [Ancylostoma ceylanicum]